MDNEERKKIGLAYPLSQLSKSLKASSKAKFNFFSKKSDQWQHVIEGMLAGRLDIGSRNPISTAPTWATPEVVTGGFVTGNLLAGGALKDYEKQLAKELDFTQDNQRAFLNAYHLSDEGISRLTTLLDTKQYRVDTPEEGALLVIAWLIRQGHQKESAHLIKEITPYFQTLRFFPTPSEKLEQAENKVYLQCAGQTIGNLENISPNKQVVQQKTTLNVWTPFYDKLASHLLALFSSQTPTEEHFSLPESEWKNTGLELLKEFNSLRDTHGISNRFIKNGAQFAKLLDILGDLASGKKEPASLNYLCQALDRYINKHGVPGTPTHKQLRQQQQQATSGSLHSDIARIVITRLKKLPQSEGITNIQPLCETITEQEANSAVSSGSPVPECLARKVGRGQVSTIDGLVKQRYITSGDGIALVLPQITSELKAAAFEDRDLRHLYSSIYQAFRKRRSLLLLNYQSQVKLKEIPWVSTIEQFRKEDSKSATASKQVLTDISCLAIKNFPYAIIPNKLLQELEALVNNANIECPLVNEVAADIFMGGFSPKFAHSAHLAGLLLKDSLYARYYGIDYELLSVNSSTSPQRGAQDFSSYCSLLAGDGSRGRSVASNGLIIEQQQIVTTQNLAALFYALDLNVFLDAELVEIAKTCFRWICHRQQIPLTDSHARLIMLKNTAYAWRQMIFFASQLNKDRQEHLLSWVNEYFYQQQDEFILRFQAVVKGFSDAVAGKRITKEARFLGWTVGRHPLMPNISPR